MKVNPWIGLIPSLAYGFSTYFFVIIGAGHMTKMMVLAFAPMLFGGVCTLIGAICGPAPRLPRFSVR